MDNWIQAFKKATPIQGIDQVIIPGEPETEIEKERLQDGIPLVQSVVDDLIKLGSKFNVPFGSN